MLNDRLLWFTGGSTGGLACSGSRRLPSDGNPNRRSLEAPLVPGGGAKDVLATGGSVATRGIGGGGARATDTLATGVWSNVMLTGRPLRGGEYGGGGSGDAVLCQRLSARIEAHERKPLTLRLLVSLRWWGWWWMWHTIRHWSRLGRANPFLRVVRLDGAHRGLRGREGAVGGYRQRRHRRARVVAESTQRVCQEGV